jgi:hypothetical protein
MRERTIQAQADAKKEFDSYVRQAAGSGGGASTADELEKLSKLKDAGTITDAEFQAQKAKLLS